MKRRLVLAALSLAALLPACSILPEREAVDVYLLPGAIDHAAAPAGPQIDVSLRVLRPVSGSRIAGRRIVVIPDDRLVSVYQGAAWTDPAPVLMRERIVDALLAGQRFASVSTDERSLFADFELDTELRAFQSEYRNGRPEAVIRIDVRLAQGNTRHIVASQRFEARENAAGTAVADVVDAMGRAADRVAQDIARWSAQHTATDTTP